MKKINLLIIPIFTIILIFTCVVDSHARIEVSVPQIPPDKSFSGAEFVVQSGHTTDIRTLFIDQSGKYIISNDVKGEIKIWDKQTGLLLRNLEIGTSPVKAIAVSPSGKLIAAGCEDGNVKIWSPKTARPLRTIKAHHLTVKRLAIEPTEHELISVGEENKLKIWNLETGQELKSFDLFNKSGQTSGFDLRPLNLLSLNAATNSAVLWDETKNQIMMWDLNTGKTSKYLQKGFSFRVKTVGTDASGNFLVAGGYYGETEVWDLNTGQSLTVVKNPPQEGISSPVISALTIDTTGKLLLSGNERGNIYIWDLKSGGLVRTIKDAHVRVTSLVLDPTGQSFVSGGSNGEFKIWNIGSGKPIKTLSSISSDRGGLADKIVRVAVDTNWKYLVCQTYDRKIKIWSLKSAYLMKTLEGCNECKTTFEIDPTGKFIITGHNDSSIKIWELASGTLLNTLSGPEYKRIEQIKIDPTGRYLVAIFGGIYIYSTEKDKIVNIWSLKTGELIKSISGLANAEIDSDGKFLISHSIPPTEVIQVPSGFARVEKENNSDNSTINIWNLNSGNLFKTIEVGDAKIYKMILDPIGKFIIAGSDNGKIIICNLKSGNIVRKLEWVGGYISSMEVDPTGRFVILKTSKNPDRLNPDRVRTWSIQTGKILCTADSHKNLINSTEIDPTGKFLITASYEAIKVWSLTSGEFLMTMEEKPGSYQGYDKLLIDPKGEYVIAASDKFIKMWDFHTGKLIKTLEGHTQSIFSLNIRNLDSLAKNPVIISRSYDGTTKLWELKSGNLLKTFNNSNALLIDPTGQLMVSIAGDVGVKITNILNDEQFTLVSSNTDWLVYTDDGYFDSSKRGGELVPVVKDLKVFGIDRFAVKKNRPDIILKKVGLGSDEVIAHFYNQYKKRLIKAGLKEEQLSGEVHVPEASILESKMDGKIVELKFALRDTEYNLKKYNIYVNDVPLFGALGKDISGKSITLTAKVELTTGNNKIEVDCMNEKGAESYRALTYAEYKNEVKGSLYYIGFGVSKYRDASLNLKYADKDATDLAGLFSKLKGKYDDIQVKTYINEEVTIENIKKAKELLKAAKVDDTVVLFVAGHGLHDMDEGATYYYLTYDADLSNLYGTAANFELIEDLLNGIAPRNKLLLLDTCESGEVDDDIQNNYFSLADARGFKARAVRAISVRLKRNKTDGRPYLLDRNRYIYNDLFRRSGAIVFSSSRGDEFSYESEKLKNGFFTKGIISAMNKIDGDKNKDEILAIDELRDYVTTEVTNLSSGLQHPTIDRDNIYQKFGFPLRKEVRFDGKWEFLATHYNEYYYSPPSISPVRINGYRVMTRELNGDKSKYNDVLVEMDCNAMRYMHKSNTEFDMSGKKIEEIHTSSYVLNDKGNIKMNPAMSELALKICSTGDKTLPGNAANKIRTLNIIDYGLVESAQSRSLDAPGTSLGKTIGTNMESLKVIKKTDKIFGSVGNKFGIFYVAEGEPELEGKEIKLSVKVSHPALKNPKKGEPIYCDEWVSSTIVNARHYDGWMFEYEWETVPGKWIFEIFYEGKKLAEKTFTVYK